jgi:exosortase/archaeosortase family protein
LDEGVVVAGIRMPGWVPLVPAAVVLAIHPAIWLARSWFDAGYASDGEWVFLLVVALFAWSVRSPLVSPVPPARLHAAIGLEALTAAIRAAGEALAFHMIGAFALVIDVFAIGLALGVDLRRRALSPLGLAALFALSLPVERVIQRALGYPLQLVSARGACALLEPLHPDLRCSGTLITLGDAALSIDLPCSGARGLVLLSTALLALVALGRIRGAWIALAGCLAVLGAYAANTARLFILAELLVAGADAASEPLHSIIGLACLAGAAWPIIALTRTPSEVAAPAVPSAPPRLIVPWKTGALLLAAAIAIGFVPAKPLDVSAPVMQVHLPASLDAWMGEPLGLEGRELAYYTLFGGAAAKKRYWRAGVPHVAVAVRTRAPLRHLHAPDECLIGSGHAVRLLGVRAADSTAVYRSEAPDGQVWRVEVTFVDDAGRRATSVAEAAWRWVEAPGSTWTMIERISPWAACEADRSACAEFDRHLFTAMEVRG